MNLPALEILAAVGGYIRGGEQTAVSGVSTDSRTLSAGELFVALHGDTYDGHNFIGDAIAAGAGGVVYEQGKSVPPAFSPELAAFEVTDTLRALGDLAHYWRERFGGIHRARSDESGQPRRGYVVAVTGSAGKTTVKEMAAAVLAQRYPTYKAPGNFNNLIGVPLSLLGIPEEVEAAVLELGTNHPGEIQRLSEITRPNIACVTNVGSAHLAGLKDIDGVANEKGSLARILEPDHTFVVNADDPYVLAMARETRARIIGYTVADNSVDDSVELLSASNVQETEEGMSFTLHSSRGEHVTVDTPLHGRHIVSDALAAAGIGRAADVSLHNIAVGLQQVSIPGGRLAFRHLEVADGHTVLVIDDTYNANPLSGAAALETARGAAERGGGRLILVLGEMRELGDAAREAHYTLGQQAGAMHAHVLLARGRHAEQLVRGFCETCHTSCAGEVMASNDVIFERLIRVLKPNDVLLIKGSRGEHMDDIVAALCERFPEREAGD